MRKHALISVFILEKVTLQKIMFFSVMSHVQRIRYGGKMNRSALKDVSSPELVIDGMMESDFVTLLVLVENFTEMMTNNVLPVADAQDMVTTLKTMFTSVMFHAWILLKHGNLI